MVSDAVKKMRAAGRAYIAKKQVSSKGTSTASERAKAQQDQQSALIEKWKRGEISKEEAAGGIKKISRGGGTGAAADSRKYALAQEAIKKFEAQKTEQAKIEAAKKKAAEERRIAEAKTFAEKTKIAREIIERRKEAVERRRISNLKNRLIQQNAQKTTKSLVNEKGEKVQHETIINRRTGERIFTVRNLETREIKTSTYERPSGSRRVRLTGQLIEGVQKNTLADLQRIKSQLYKGDTLIYDTNTMRIMGIRSKALNMSIPYTDKGIDYYNAKISKVIPSFDFKKEAEKTAQTIIPSKLSRNIKILSPIIFKKIDPVLKNYFAKYKIKKIDEVTLARFLYSSDFNKKVEKLSNTFFNSCTIASNNINIKINEMKRAKTNAEKNRISKEITGEKDKLIAKISKVALLPGNWTKRQVTMFTLGLVGHLFKFAGSIPAIGSMAVTGVTVGLPIVIKGTPYALKKLVTDPKNVIKKGYTVSKAVTKTVSKAVWEKGKVFGKLLIVEPGLAVGMIVGELFILRGIGKGFEIVGKVRAPLSKLLNPSFKNLKNGEIIIRKAPAEIFKVGGKERYLKKRVKKPSIIRPFSSVADFLKGRKPGQFKKFTKDPGIILKEQTVATGSTPLSESVKLAGQEVTAVNASANQLTSWIRRKRIIRKPFNLTGLEKKFPKGEKSFPLKIKKILDKFDNGKKLTVREFANINLWLQKNIASNITLLERSLYLDPASGLRISRLGVKAEKSATMMDILRGNFRLWGKAGKPQVLIFENAKVAKFPKSLKDIENKLKADKTLTVSETNRLIRWQMETGSGKFKPIGSTIYQGGEELEVTLGGGEYIKRIKQVGITYIKGKKVTFVTAKVLKVSPKIRKQISLAKLGKLTNIQLSKLEKFLSKTFGRKIKVETPSNRKLLIRIDKRIARRTDASIPVLRLEGKSLRVLFRSLRLPAKRVVSKRIVGKSKLRTTPRPISKITGRAIPRPKTKVRTTPRPTPRTVRKISGKTTPRPRIKPRPAIKPSPKPKPKPPIRPFVPKHFTQKKLSKKVPTYYVVIKRYNKLVKLLARPLRLSDAKDYLAFRIDKGLGRSAWFEPVGLTKNVIGLPKEMKGYFNKISNKLRPFRLDRGKRLGIRNGYIEKKKYIGDTKSEIRELQKARLKSKIKRKIPLKKTSKAITRLSNQRKKKSNRITTQKSKVTTKKKKVKNPTKRKTKKLIKKRKLKRKS